MIMSSLVLWIGYWRLCSLDSLEFELAGLEDLLREIILLVAKPDSTGSTKRFPSLLGLAFLI